jgi:hypothetical protein
MGFGGDNQAKAMENLIYEIYFNYVKQKLILFHREIKCDCFSTFNFKTYKQFLIQYSYNIHQWQLVSILVSRDDAEKYLKNSMLKFLYVDLRFH